MSFIAAYRDSLLAQVEALVHPAVGGDALAAPRHRAFLAGCLVTGLLALIILPLHLALAGAPGFPVTLMLGFMLAQWPLAMFLSQTGRLDWAHGISAGLFATFLAGLAAITGGLSSLALIWMAIVPVEAAQSGSRRVVIGAGLACAALVCVLAALPALPAVAGSTSPVAVFLSLAGAIVYGAALAHRLVSDQVRGRTLLDDGDKRAQLLNTHSTEVICACRRDGRVRLLSGPVETLLDVPTRLLRGEWLFQRLHVADRPAYLLALAHVRAGGIAQDLQLRMRRGHAEPGESGLADYRWVRLNLKPVALNEDGQAREDVILTLRDVSRERAERDALAAELERAEDQNRDHARALMTAGGEMRKPLADIVGYAELLRAKPFDQDRIRPVAAEDYAGRIHQSGQHLLEIVETLLETSRADTGSRPLNIVPVDLPACVAICLAELAPAADARGLRLTADLGPDLPAFAGDLSACHQVVKCLVSAAIKGSAAGAEVTVSLRAEDARIVLAVAGSAPVDWSGPGAYFVTLAGKLTALQGGDLTSRGGARITCAWPRARRQRTECDGAPVPAFAEDLQDIA